MIKPNSPCKSCEKRTLGCHANCEDYKTYTKLNEEYRVLVQSERGKICAVDKYEKEKMGRLVKYR